MQALLALQVISWSWERLGGFAFNMLLAWMVAISANRMAFGSHFLSDVVIAWAMMLLVVIALRDLVLVRCPDSAFTAIETGLARVGDLILAPFRPRV